MIRQLQLVHSDLLGATKTDELRFSMARETTMTPILNPTLAEVTIYTSVATATFLALSLAVILLGAICQGSCVIASNLV